MKSLNDFLDEFIEDERAKDDNEQEQEQLAREWSSHVERELSLSNLLIHRSIEDDHRALLAARALVREATYQQMSEIDYAFIADLDLGLEEVTL